MAAAGAAFRAGENNVAAHPHPYSRGGYQGRREKRGGSSTHYTHGRLIHTTANTWRLIYTPANS